MQSSNPLTTLLPTHASSFDARISFIKIPSMQLAFPTSSPFTVDTLIQTLSFTAFPQTQFVCRPFYHPFEVPDRIAIKETCSSRMNSSRLTGKHA